MANSLVEPEGVQAAVKVIKASDNPERARRRYLSEANALASLAHPRIPWLIETNVLCDADEDTKSIYLAIEYIPGATLANILESGTIFSLDEALDLVMKILETVEYIHEYGLIHADVNPLNVIFRDNNKEDPVLVDFHLAQDANQVQNVHGVKVPAVEFDIIQIPRLILQSITGELWFPFADWRMQPPHANLRKTEPLTRLTGPRVECLMRMFQRAFSFNAKQRFHSIAELRAELQQLRSTPENE